jgi:uncharacterized metal-binding protein
VDGARSFEKDTEHYKLKLNDLSAEEKGTYMCEDKNEYGTYYFEFDLDVKSKQIQRKIN